MKLVMNDFFLKLMFNILKNYMTYTIIGFFLPKRMTIEIVKNVVANLRDKNEYVLQPKNLKQALNHRLVLKKLY